MDSRQTADKQRDNKVDITEDELQGIYMYLAMHYEELDIEQRKIWYLLMEELDPMFKIIEDDEI